MGQLEWRSRLALDEPFVRPADGRGKGLGLALHERFPSSRSTFFVYNSILDENATAWQYFECGFSLVGKSRIHRSSDIVCGSSQRITACVWEIKANTATMYQQPLSYAAKRYVRRWKLHAILKCCGVSDLSNSAATAIDIDTRFTYHQE